MTVWRRWGAVLLISTLLAACAEEPATDTGAEPAAEEHAVAGVEAVGLGEAMGQIRGHHLAAIELYDAGDEKGAAVHAGHPIAEILASVQSELAEHDPAIGDELESALDAVADGVAQGAPVEDLQASIEDAAAVTQEVLGAVVGEDADTPSFKGSVIAALLATAAHEYEEAVGDKGIRLLAEFQDGYAFVQEARRLYEEIAGGSGCSRRRRRGHAFIQRVGHRRAARHRGTRIRRSGR